VILLALAVLRISRSLLVFLYYGTAIEKPQATATTPSCPRSTVQLPLFNEMYVSSACSIPVASFANPHDRFQNPVSTTPTDETQDIAAQDRGPEEHHPDLDIEYVPARTGRIQAGALENGLRTAKASCVIFDADFLPKPDILERTCTISSTQRGGRAVSLGAHQPRLLGADRGAGPHAQRALHHGACRAQRSGRFFNSTARPVCGAAPLS